jgi:hypothetical protein
MKVYEIIVETKTQEGLIAQGVEKLSSALAKGGKFISSPIKALRRAAGAIEDKIAADIVAIAKDKDIKAADAATEYLRRNNAKVNREMMTLEREYKEAGRAVPNQATLRSQAIDSLGMEAEQLDAAVIKRATAQMYIGKAGLGLEKVSVWGSVTKVVKGALWGWNIKELLQPYLDFVSKMDGYKKTKLDTGVWTEDEYNAVLNQEATIMLARWAAVLAGGTVFYALTGGPFLRKLTSKIPGFNTVLLGGAVAVKSWINNEDNANYIAALIADNIPELAQSIGEVVNNALSKVPKIARPAIPSADNPDSEYNKQQKIAGSPNGTSQNTVDQTSDAGNTTVNPATGRTSSGRKMYYNDNWHSNNQDITGWIVDPGNPKMIQDPNNPAARALKPPGWQPD